MAAVPESKHTTATAIVRWYESKPQEHRPHMGASIIGHPCERNVWLTWRWALKPTFPGRILRLFSSGVREESRLIEELRGIGVTVWDVNPETGAQWRVSACNGHFGGSLDGVAKGVPEAPKSPCVLEFKTHNDKSFNELCKSKVQGAKPQHYDQMQVYMGLMEIDRALYMAVNKNTDDVYVEWVHFDQERFTALMDKAQRLIGLTEPPVKFSEDPSNYECKRCTFYGLCHGDRAAEANCRTCCHASPGESATWHCGFDNNAVLPDVNQRTGCNHHLMIPALVPYGEPIDGGENWIAYKHRESGAYFVNGPEGIKDYGPVFASKELHHCPGELIKDMAELKGHFPGSKVVKPSTPAPRTAFDDMESDDLDKVATKPEPAAKKEARRKNAAIVAAMQEFAGRR